MAIIYVKKVAHININSDARIIGLMTYNFGKSFLIQVTIFCEMLSLKYAHIRHI